MDIWVSFITTITVILLTTVPDILPIQPPGFLGCYKDKLGRIFKNINKTLDYNIYEREDVVNKCIKFCRSSKNRYAGAKFHSQNMKCFCGTVIHSSDPTSCEEYCPGNGKKECAGPEAIGLYDTWPCAAEPCKNSATCEDIDADNYKCSCTKGWKGVNCDEGEEVNHPNAVEVLVPTVLTIVAVIAIVIFLIIRRRRNKTTTDISHKGSAGGVDNQYVGYQRHPSQQPSIIYTPESYSSPYAEIPLEGFNRSSKNDPSAASIKPDNQYNVPNVQSSPALATCSNYSHLEINQAILNSAESNTYSHTTVLNDKNQIKPTSSTDGVENTYNILQISSKPKVANKSANDISDASVYNHAKAGGRNPKNTGIDDYSHLNTVNR
ncbi:uncharacterized protein LOC123540367 isoform X2 [Mercenaria mercenaria]|uniref:uncharacterized protein LOC123540367 isoform X2 n=1 Tax=Mercenaria mercenaria TaxID=6596 RepID=UPI00234F2B15|nr:uncharacterized protein LOC123540367 isoform X2 [Mercenaria mercenaria]